ncbi:MAG: chromosome segregation protein SMC, partial [Proteobacteria bacterium]|nr:chromosome segregation protein SMC [Pseudomonadota bacterium]
MQESALGTNNNDLNAWLQTHGLHDVPRLAQSIKVESGWETAVEIVLGTKLQALCIEDMTILQEALINPPSGKLALFETSHNIEKTENNIDSLLDKIQAPWPLSTLLAGVKIAVDIKTAYQIRKQLAEYESVITPIGL